jgi:glyoxylase-like metal-dependent hydrolase (beta-lactamase superfamily II)
MRLYRSIRRRSGVAAAAFAALCACSPLAARPAPYVLQPGHIDLDRGPDGNTVILDTAQGLVVVDTGRSADHSALIVKQANWVRKPVIALVNTHWHLDHTTGNRDLLALWPKARLVATAAIGGALDGFLRRSREQSDKALADPKLPEAERARILRANAAMDDRAALVPAQPVTRDGPAKIGARRFDLYVANAAATEADLWLTVPDEQLAVVGDLVVAPVPFFDTGCEDGWKAALAAISAAKWKVLIPGHGAPMNRAEFGRWRTAFGAWLDCAHSQAAVKDCTDGWMKGAEGFYTEAEAPSVILLSDYYVAQILRAPADKRMAYCRKV